MFGFSIPYQIRSLHKNMKCSLWKTTAMSQYPIRCFLVRSRKVLKLRDLYLELCGRFKIWQGPRQQCCRGAGQISRQYKHLNTRFRAFETLRNLTTRCLIWYWNRAQNSIWYILHISYHGRWCPRWHQLLCMVLTNLYGNIPVLATEGWSCPLSWVVNI